MDGHVNVPENCNGCKFKQEMGRHWELEDYCFLNQISISRIDMEKDCPLWGKEGIMHRVPHCRRCKGIKGAVGYTEYYVVRIKILMDMVKRWEALGQTIRKRQALSGVQRGKEHNI